MGFAFWVSGFALWCLLGCQCPSCCFLYLLSILVCVRVGWFFSCVAFWVGVVVFLFPFFDGLGSGCLALVCFVSSFFFVGVIRGISVCPGLLGLV